MATIAATPSSSILEGVPMEVLCSIFERMDISTVILSRLVCSSWKRLIDPFFVKASLKLTDETYDFVRNCNLETNTMKVKNFSIDCSMEPRTISRNKLAKSAKHIIFAPSSSSASHGRKSIQENMTTILTLNPAIESLVFEENSLKNIKSLSLRGIPFTRLTCLSVDFSYATDSRVFLDFVDLRLPVLKSVQLSEYWSEYGPENGSGYFGMYRFLANHKRTLKFVTLVHPMRNTDIRAASNSPLTTRKFEALKKDLSEIKLTSLYLYFVSIEGTGTFTLGGHLLQSQRSLTKLQVAIGGNYFYALAQVKEAILANASTLEYVSILSHEQWGVYVNLSNTLSALPVCCKLESFEVDHFFIPSLPSFPPSVKTLTISGYLLSDQILPQIDENLVNLEQLCYTDLSSYPYIHFEDIGHFNRILGLPRLKRIRVCKQHLTSEFEHFLDEHEGISWSEVAAEVTFRDNFLPFYEITTNNNNNT
ncbi:unnamed protein product [Allacma fusca]|uniref:F-box domain-containing protein n=1 Tax=Allacma fusca TaxID=39272 RepID=A0A8J2JRA6_9HEXA|nr:unnamed protein product [Allacma fusca]